MVNAVIEHMDDLTGLNYVRKADPKRNYWLDFSQAKMNEKVSNSGGSFFIIVHGSNDDDSDYFVVPYRDIEGVFTPHNLTKDRNRSPRWTGNIYGTELKITGFDVRFDLREYRGNLPLLRRAMGRSGGVGYVSPDEGAVDTDDEMQYSPTSGDQREAVFRQIRARRGQQDFRADLRSRYGDACMISNCRLMDVVEAAHIKPYHVGADHHPANGLLLRADIHTLFDLDLIGIEPDTLIVRVHPAASAAGYGQFDGLKLACGLRRPSADALARRWKDWRGHGHAH